MARTISKSISSATINVLDPSKSFKTDVNGMPIANVSFVLDGNPTMNKARIAAQKFCGSKNVMVLSIDVDETKLTVSPDVFIANSSVCDPNEVYGREYVTQTFKITTYHGFYIDPENCSMVQFENCYFGETTANKLLKHAQDAAGTLNCVVTDSSVSDERRYMSREKYMQLAR